MNYKEQRNEKLKEKEEILREKLQNTADCFTKSMNGWHQKNRSFVCNVFVMCDNINGSLNSLGKIVFFLMNYC